VVVELQGEESFQCDVFITALVLWQPANRRIFLAEQVAMVLVEAILPSSKEITEEDCAGGVLPSMALMTLDSCFTPTLCAF